MSKDINSIVTTTSKPASNSMIPSLIAFVLIIGFIFWTNYQQKQEGKKKLAMLNELKVGDVIQTYGGLVGTISFISEDKTMIDIKTGMDFSSTITINSKAIDQKIDSSK